MTDNMDFVAWIFTITIAHLSVVFLFGLLLPIRNSL